MTYRRQIFEFDPAKAASNLKKHKVSFAEAITVFEDPLASTLPDDQHSLDDDRFITVGMSAKHRILFVVYTGNQIWNPTHWSPPRDRNRDGTI